MPLQGIAPESSWLGGAFLKYYKKICKIKEGNENKIMLGVLNCTIDKIYRDGENKIQRLYGAVPIMPCLNSSLIIGFRIYEEGRTQILASSSATIGPLPKISIHRLY